ncbi:MAG TPA: DUF4142 domain-containing protein [Caulobacteraceae bacterium]|nr:DUF4142 domain-containing protein [Caulobacteraceae bacterium]
MLRKALLASAFALATAPVLAQVPHMFAQSGGSTGSTTTQGPATPGPATHNNVTSAQTLSDTEGAPLQPEASQAGATHHSGAIPSGATQGRSTSGQQHSAATMNHHAGSTPGMSHASLHQSAVTVAPMGAVSTEMYLRKTASTDLYEIESGRLALERSQSAEVRQFAQAMIDHHTQTSAMLTQAASQAGSAPAPKMDPAHQAMLTALRDAPAGEFDSLYMRQQITGHMNNLAIQTGYAGQGEAQPLRQVAAAASPVVQSHLDAAWSMSEIPQTMAMHRQQDEQRFAALDASTGRRDSRGYMVLGPGAWGDTAMADARTTTTFRGYDSTAGTTGVTTGTTGATTTGTTGVTTSGMTTSGMMTSATAAPGAGAAAGMASDTASGRADQQFGISGPGSTADSLRTGTSVNAQPGVGTGVSSTAPTGGSGTSGGTGTGTTGSGGSPTGSGEDEGGDPPTGD